MLFVSVCVIGFVFSDLSRFLVCCCLDGALIVVGDVCGWLVVVFGSLCYGVVSLCVCVCLYAHVGYDY